jgi:hypothetical protein
MSLLSSASRMRPVAKMRLAGCGRIENGRRVAGIVTIPLRRLQQQGRRLGWPRRRHVLLGDLFGWQMSATSGKGNHERRALLFHAGNTHASAMQLDQVLHQRQADAGAFEAAPLRLLDPMKAIEDMRQLVRGNAHAGVAHPQLGVPVLPMQGNLDLALQGELEGIGDQVEHQLFPLRRIHVDRLGQRRAVDDEPHAGLFDQRMEGAGQFARQRGKVGRHEAQRKASRVDARDVEQAVHQAQQANAVSMHDLHVIAVQGRMVGERVFDDAEDERQRRSKLVADIAEKGGLGAIDLGQRFCTQFFFLKRTRIDHGARHLVGNGQKEGVVALIQASMRADACHQQGGWCSLARAVERQHDRFFRPCIPRAHGHGPEAGR